MASRTNGAREMVVAALALLALTVGATVGAVALCIVLVLLVGLVVAQVVRTAAAIRRSVDSPDTPALRIDATSHAALINVPQGTFDSARATQEAGERAFFAWARLLRAAPEDLAPYVRRLADSRRRIGRLT